MTTQNGQPGGQKIPGKLIAVRRLKRIAESQPTAWEGITDDGDRAHIAYRFGEVRVDLRRPVEGRPGAAEWVTVARFQPGMIAAHLNAKSEMEERMLRLMAERAIHSEMKRSVTADMRYSLEAREGRLALDGMLDRDRLIIRDEQLVSWIAMRNHDLSRLARNGLSGGMNEVHVEFVKKEKAAK